MKITDDKTLRELQDEFCKEFPFLKVEFFGKTEKGAIDINGQVRFNRHKLVGEVRNTRNCGYIKLDPNLTSSALESTFQNIFGLNARVYRKSFGNWVQTWPSEAWTLKEQNLRSMISEDKAVIV